MQNQDTVEKYSEITENGNVEQESSTSLSTSLTSETATFEARTPSKIASPLKRKYPNSPQDDFYQRIFKLHDVYNSGPSPGPRPGTLFVPGTPVLAMVQPPLCIDGDFKTFIHALEETDRVILYAGRGDCDYRIERMLNGEYMIHSGQNIWDVRAAEPISSYATIDVLNYITLSYDFRNFKIDDRTVPLGMCSRRAIWDQLMRFGDPNALRIYREAVDVLLRYQHECLFSSQWDPYENGYAFPDAEREEVNRLVRTKIRRKQYSSNAGWFLSWFLLAMCFASADSAIPASIPLPPAQNDSPYFSFLLAIVAFVVFGFFERACTKNVFRKLNRFLDSKLERNERHQNVSKAFRAARGVVEEMFYDTEHVAHAEGGQDPLIERLRPPEEVPVSLPEVPPDKPELDPDPIPEVLALPYEPKSTIKEGLLNCLSIVVKALWAALMFFHPTNFLYYHCARFAPLRLYLFSFFCIATELCGYSWYYSILSVPLYSPLCDVLSTYLSIEDTWLFDPYPYLETTVKIKKVVLKTEDADRISGFPRYIHTDLSCADTVSDDSTIESEISINEITLGEETPSVFGQMMSNEIFQSCFKLIMDLYYGPRSSTHSTMGVTFYYGVTIFKFLSLIIDKNRGAASQAFEMVLKDLKIKAKVLGFNTGEIEGPDETPSWWDTLGDNIAQLGTLEKSKLGKGFSSFMALLACTPIFFYDLGKASDYMQVYKTCVKFLSNGSISLSSVCKMMVHTANTLIGCAVTGNFREVFNNLFVADNVTLRYVEAMGLSRKLKNGELKMSKTELMKVRKKFLVIKKEIQNKIIRDKDSVIDASRLVNVEVALEDFDRAMVTKSTKAEPFVVALCGPPGIGKTVMMEYICYLLHVWAKMVSIMSMAPVTAASKFDEAPTNSTTAILFDDEGLILPEKRERTFSSLMSRVVSSTYVMMNKASLEEKGKNYFMHDFVLCTDNNRMLGFEKESSCPMAQYRRRQFCVDSRIKSEFTDIQGKVRKDGTEIPAFGKHMIYTIFTYIPIEGTNRVETLNLHENIEAEDMFKHMKIAYDDHAEAQRQRAEKTIDLASMSLCGTCQVMPFIECSCPLDADGNPPPNLVEDELFYETDASSVSSSEEEDLKIIKGDGELGFNVTEWLPTVAGTSHEIDHYQAAACWIRLQVIGFGRRSSIVRFVYRHHVIEIALGFPAIVFLVLSIFEKSIVLRVISLLIVLVCLFSYLAIRKIRRHFNDFVFMRSEEVVNLYVHHVKDNMTSAAGRASLNLFVGVAGLLAINGVWDHLYAHMFPSTGESDSSAEQQPSPPGLEIQGPVVPEPVVVHKPLTYMEINKTSGPWAPVEKVKQKAFKCAHTISNEDIVEKVTRNLYRMILISSTGVTGRGHIFFINSTIAVVPAHYVATPDFHKCTLQIFDHVSQAWRQHELTSADMICIPNTDMVFLHIANMRMGPLLPSLEEYLPKTLGSSGSRATYQHVRISDKDYQPLPANIVEGTVERAVYTVGKTVYDGERMMTFVLPTTSYGYCGSIYVSQRAPRTISALHVAGNKVNLGIAVSLTHDVFLRAEEHFKMTGGYLKALKHLPPPQVIAGAVIGLTQKFNKTSPVNFLPEGNIVQVIGEIPVNHIPRSNLCVNTHIEAARTALKLKILKFKPIMKWRNSNRKILVTATAPLPSLDSAKFHKVSLEFEQMFRNSIDKMKLEFPDVPLDRPLTDSEVINGINGTPIYCMKKTTSSGHGGKKGDLLTEVAPSTYAISPVVSDDLLLAVEKLTRGFAIGEISMIALKDEAVKLEKLDTTRGFTVLAFVEHLITLRFTTGLLHALSNNNNECETAIGLNRVGPGWHSFVEPFFQSKFEGGCFDIDYKSFDQTQSPQIRGYVFQMILNMARYAGWEDRDVEVLECVFSNSLCPLLCFGGTVTAAINLLVSGIVWTAHVNGLASSLLARYDYERFVDSLDASVAIKFEGKYTEHRVNGTLGDDLIGAASKELRDAGWTLQHLSDTATMVGMHMTNGSKTSNVLEFKEAKDLEFLKSYVGYQSDLGLNVSVVSPASTLRSFHWFLKGNDYNESEYQGELISNAMMEAFYGGRNSYDEMQRRMFHYIALAKVIAIPRMLTLLYDERVAYEISRLGDYERQSPLVSETEMGIRLIKDYDALDDVLQESDGPDDVPEADAESEITTNVGMEENILVQSDTPEQDQVSMAVHQTNVVEQLPIDPNASVDMVLKRRVALAKFTWTPEGLPIPSMNVFSLMLDQPLFYPRLSNLAYFRGNIKITFETSAPSSVSGAFMASFFANFPENLNFDVLSSNTAQNICRMSQLENLMVVCGNGDGVFSITIPFLHQKPYLNVREQDANLVLPNMKLIELVPITSVLGLTPNVLVKVYGQWQDLEVFGATELLHPNKPVFTAEGGAETMSQKVSAIADIAMAASGVPGLAGLAVPAQIVKSGAGLAHHFGFSKPLSTTGTYTVPMTTTGMANIRDVTAAKVLSPDPDQNVSPSGYMNGLDGDDLTVMKFANSWSIAAVVDMSTNHAEDYVLFDKNVTPSVFIIGAPNSPTVKASLQPCSCAVPSMFFKYWNGSMQYRITVVAPTNISGWLRVVYDPLVKAHQVLQIEPNQETTDSTMDTNEHILINLETTRLVEFDVHWCSDMPALFTLPTNFALPPNVTSVAGTQSARTCNDIWYAWSDVDSGVSEAHNGRFRVEVHQQLATSSGITAAVGLIIECRAHSNMKYFEYAGSNLNGPILSTTPISDMGDAWKQSNDDVPIERVSFQSNCTAVQSCAEGLPAPPKDSIPPTFLPTNFPTMDLSNMPSQLPTRLPSDVPTKLPTTKTPSSVPSHVPSKSSMFPSWVPSWGPTSEETLEETYSYPAKALICISDPSYIAGVMGSTELRVFFKNLTDMNIGKFSLFAESGTATYTLPTYGTLGNRDGDVDVRVHNSASTLTSADAATTCVTNTVLVKQCSVHENGGTSACQVFGTVTSSHPFHVSNKCAYTPEGWVLYKDLVGLRSASTTFDSPATPWSVLTSGVPLSSGGFTPGIYNSTNFDGVGFEDMLQVPHVVVFRGALTVSYGPTTYTVSSADLRSVIVSVPVGMQLVLNVAPAVGHGVFSVTWSAPPGLPSRRKLLATGEMEPDTAGPFKFGTIGTNDHIYTSFAGEQLVSFRALMKIPYPHAQIAVGSTPGSYGEISLSQPMYAINTSPSLFNYMMKSFIGVRGGMVSYYSVIGDAFVEAARVSSTPTTAKANGLSGVEILDTRVNPTLVVKYPYYSPILYDHTGMNFHETWKSLSVHTWNGPVTIREYIATGEDFNLICYRGAAKLYDP